MHRASELETLAYNTGYDYGVNGVDGTHVGDARDSYVSQSERDAFTVGYSDGRDDA